MLTPPELSPLEATVGFPLGGRTRFAAARARVSGSPVDALCAAVSRTLDRGSPAVAFSGGRDSSLLLAVAAAVCRRAGVEPPLPITLCLPASIPEADERTWQERVLQHLGISEWRRIAIADELDLIGPYARQHLLRDGVLFPANTHSVVPMLEAAGERCLIVGLGGDELLSPGQWRSVQDLFGRRRRPTCRDVARLAAGALPRPVRGLARRSRRDELHALRWLRPLTRARLSYSVRIGFEEPVRWNAAISHVAARRDVVLALRSMQRLAAAGGHAVRAPLLDQGFVSALTRAGGRSGWGTRTAMTATLARDLLPPDVIGRKDKAGFNRAFFADHSRAFAGSWSGRGLNTRLIDPDALRREWLSDVPDFRSALLLQIAWLAEHGDITGASA